MTKTPVHSDAFLKRREELKARLDPLDPALSSGDASGPQDRMRFFDAVYALADGDAAAVPWADLAPKHELSQWLAENPVNRSKTAPTAIDVAAGLGDNAVAIAEAGYRTTAFDLSQGAIDWASRRFADSSVSWQVADLLDPPAEWQGAFDLVHECYTLQAVPPSMLEAVTRGVAALVAPGGTLLVYTRIRAEGQDADGPPWPLLEREAMRFETLGFTLVSRKAFAIERPGRSIPHWFCVWKREA
ncbi:MAG: methyltransferase domain-containing protein [Rhizobiaceae bacterium]